MYCSIRQEECISIINQINAINKHYATTLRSAPSAIIVIAAKVVAAVVLNLGDTGTSGGAVILMKPHLRGDAVTHGDDDPHH